MTTRAWAHAIVRRYPPAWRERYEAEVRGLIDDTSVQFRDLGELIRGLFTERARELLMSDENPRRTALVVGLATPIAGALFIGTAWLTAFGLLTLTGPWPESLQYAALGGFCLAFGSVMTLMIRSSKRRDPARRFIVPPDVAVRVLPLTFVAAVLFSAAVAGAEPSPPSTIPSWIIHSYNWAWFALFAGNQIASFFPGQELLKAFAKISVAEVQIRTNQQWVASCHDWIAKGVPSPLNDALQQVGKWTLERDSARARLKELGYRARFRGPIGHGDDQGIVA
ncbi:MAG TPA: hypothetical protein VMS54_09365 [Vicinamibacterales bacterium]|nr:hypothetical protein [Vicinamibacterales bacterium]